MVRYTMQEIRASYEQKRDWEKQFPVSRFLFRPVSFFLTYGVLRVTQSAGLIALIGLIIGLLGCSSFLYLRVFSIWAGIIALILFALLDAVDGNIARVTKKVTYYGKLLDGVCGILIDASYCLFLSLGLYFHSGTYYLSGFVQENKFLLLLYGVVIMAGRLYSTVFECNYQAFIIEKQKVQGTFQETLHDTIKSSSYRKYWWYLVFINLNAINLQLLMLVVSVMFKAADLFLFFLATYYVARFLVILVFYLYRAKRLLS